jgi:energy-coupling factor transporter transmembrane protein EcfT
LFIIVIIMIFIVNIVIMITIIIIIIIVTTIVTIIIIIYDINVNNIISIILVIIILRASLSIITYTDNYRHHPWNSNSLMRVAHEPTPPHAIPSRTLVSAMPPGKGTLDTSPQYYEQVCQS